MLRVYKVMRRIDDKTFSSCLDRWWNDDSEDYNINYHLHRVESGRGPYFCFVDSVEAIETATKWNSRLIELCVNLEGRDYCCVECLAPKVWTVGSVGVLLHGRSPEDIKWIFNRSTSRVAAVNDCTSMNYLLYAVRSLIPMEVVSSEDAPRHTGIRFGPRAGANGGRRRRL